MSKAITHALLGAAYELSAELDNLSDNLLVDVHSVQEGESLIDGLNVALDSLRELLSRFSKKIDELNTRFIRDEYIV